MDVWPDVADPDPAWARLAKSGCPTWVDTHRLWLVHSPEHVDAVARDPARFSSAVPGDRDMSFDFLLTVDPPRHGIDRRAFLRSFSPRLHATSLATPKYVAQAAAGVETSDRIDLVSAFCQPLADAVRDGVVGRFDPHVLSRQAPADIRTELLHLAGAETRGTPDADAPFDALLQELLRDGTAPHVAAGRVSGLACAVLLALKDTLSAAIALALLRIAKGTSPPASAEIGDDSPLLGLYRVAREDVVLGDATISAGDRLFIAWAAASHHSPNNYTYGAGPHRCPAAYLAHAVVTEAVTHAMKRWAFELTEAPRFGEHPHFRSPKALICNLEVLS